MKEHRYLGRWHPIYTSTRPLFHIPPISVESENSDDLVCVRLLFRSAASESQILTGIIVTGQLGENRNILHKSDFVGENGINIPPISVESENSDDLVCVRLLFRSAASEPDADWNYSSRATGRK